MAWPWRADTTGRGGGKIGHMTQPVIAVFTKNLVNPAYAAARLAVDRVAAEAGARTIHYAPQTPDNVAEQKALVTEALAARPAAVVLNPADDVAMQEDLVGWL